MQRPFQERNLWALILGGSSGIGLATAKKLASWGMNVAVVHRDRRGSMAQIESEFEAIRKSGVKFLSFNVNALAPDGIGQVLDGLRDGLGGGKVRVVLHSIALGNLKLLAPRLTKTDEPPVQALAQSLGLDAMKLQSQVDQLFADGHAELLSLTQSDAYDNDHLANEEDFAGTVYNMGSSLLTWVRSLFEKGFLADDTRVIGLTSEGNRIAWRGYAPVSAAKAVLESVSRAIAAEYAPYGVRSNIVQPGVTDTAALRHIPGNQIIKAEAVRRNPMGRLTTPEDVAGVIALLATDEAQWINGALIRVDGGEAIGG